MKKLILFTLLFPTILMAQQIIAPNKIWRNHFTIAPGGTGGVPYTIFTNYSLTTDTSINGKTYKQVAISNGDPRFIRENGDSTFYLEGSNEILLYNFGLQVNDSVNLTSIHFGSYYYKVIAIDSEMVDGVYEKKIAVRTNRSHPHLSAPYTIYWIKRIGDKNYGLFSLYNSDLGYGTTLDCVAENNADIYGSNCALGVAEDKENKLFVKLRNNQVLLHSTIAMKNFVLLSLTGQVIADKKIDNSYEIVVDIPGNIADAIYIAHIITADGKSHTVKLLAGR